jgi:hypothetical protein
MAFEAQEDSKHMFHANEVEVEASDLPIWVTQVRIVSSTSFQTKCN